MWKVTWTEEDGTEHEKEFHYSTAAVDYVIKMEKEFPQYKFSLKRVRDKAHA